MSTEIIHDHVLVGGFGSGVLEALQEGECTTAVERFSWSDKLIERGRHHLSTSENEKPLPVVL